MNAKTIMILYCLRREFWRIVFRLFDATQRAQDRLPARLRFHTEWETKLWFWLMLRGY